MYDSAWAVLHCPAVWELSAVAHISIGSFESQPEQACLELRCVRGSGASVLLEVLQGGPTLRCFGKGIGGLGTQCRVDVLCDGAP